MTVLSALLHVYVFIRADSLPIRRKYIPRKALVITGVCCWAIFLAGRMCRHSTGIAAFILGNTGMHLMTFLFVLSEAGIRLLCNEWEQAADGLVIAGVKDLTIAQRRHKNGTEWVDKTFEGIYDQAVIYLSHTPWLAEEAAGKGAGLMLSGHTHGGQVWPFGYLVKMHYPYFYETVNFQISGKAGRGK